MGQNGGFTDTANLINQHKYAIDYLNSKVKDYLIIGLTTGTQASRASYEADMLNAFGRRFINAREYISAYGMSDLGLTPTAQDSIDMGVGQIPESLMYDSIHMNANGYTVLGNLVYKRLVEYGLV